MGDAYPVFWVIIGSDGMSYPAVMLEVSHIERYVNVIGREKMSGVVGGVGYKCAGGVGLADGAQSSRVPVPLLVDPYEVITQAYLDGTNTESEPFEDPIDTETPESPLTIAPPILLLESTSPALVPILHRIARMAVRVPPAMSSTLSASMAEVAAMFESAFCKRFRSSYESSPSLSPLDLPLRKRFRGTSELVEDSEEDDNEEDEEIEESLDSNSVSEDAKDEGPIAKDDNLAAGDEGLSIGVEGPGMDDKSHGLDDESRGLDDEGHSVESNELGLEEEEVVPGGQQQAALVVGTAVSAPLGLGYGALRRRELELEEDHPTLTTWTNPEDGMVYIDVPAYPPPVHTPPSPEWTSSSLPISPSPSIELSPALFERSLEYEQERVTLTFGAIWRPVLALESWASQTDAQRTALWHVIGDMQGENQDLRL
ncbi:hypothetical protein Tco_0938053 [Tanacetum coccineum]|uniref:Uncharacterized protein n=1 Tax=Tanacetum coccineum TaxID=301880 RepID=A0ABQ5DIS2_9ASTR